ADSSSQPSFVLRTPPRTSLEGGGAGGALPALTSSISKRCPARLIDSTTRLASMSSLGERDEPASSKRASTAWMTSPFPRPIQFQTVAPLRPDSLRPVGWSGSNTTVLLG